MPLNCRAITLTAGAVCKGTKPSLVGRGNLGGIFRDNLGEGNYELRNAARQWESTLAAKHLDVFQSPGIFLYFQAGGFFELYTETAES